MAGNIKGITIEIDGDTSKLSTALKSAEKSTKDVNSELKQVNNLLKFNPGNADLIAQKQELLAKQVQNTSAKLKTLKDAQAQVETQFKSGDLGEDEYRAFQREVVATEGKLQNYQGQLKQSEFYQAELASSAKQLGVLFIASGRDVDSFREVIGNKLADAIKNGTASAKDMKEAFSKIAQESGVAKGDVNELAQSFDKFDGSDRSLKQVTKSLDDLGNKSESSKNALGSFKEKLSFGAVAGVANSAIQSLTGGIGNLISEGISASDAMDKFKSTLKFAGLGSDKIDKASAAVKKYADDTVYELSDVSNMTAQLAANGIQDYTGLTEAAGNLNAVAGGNADTFKSVGMVMTQTAGAGKLTTENWNQLADAIPGASGKLQEAMKKNGAYTGNFRDAMEKGMISSDEFNAAVKQLGENDGAVKAAKSTTTFEGAIGNLQANVVSGVQDIINSIGKANFTNLISTISDGVVGALDLVVKALKFVSEVFNVYKTIITTVFNAIKTVIETVWNAIKTAITTVINVIKTVISTVFNGIKTVITNIWNGIKSVTSNVWNGIKTTISNVINGVKSTVSKVVNGIKDTISNIWNGIKSTTTSVWNGIKGAIERPMNAAKNIVRAAIQKIKSLFNFKITWPHIPLPHFNISGSFNPLKGKIPKIGVNWYANGGIMTKPTMFANNGGNVSIGGEAGPEGVIPLNEKTLAAIGKGIADASGDTGGTTINLTVYGELTNATARKWADTIAVELERLRKRDSATGGDFA